MKQAILLAKKGQNTASPNPCVGAVIVRNNAMLSQGFHAYTGQKHAEIIAIEALQESQTKGADIYITLEPCVHQGKQPPCVDRVIQAGFKRVFIAMLDPNPKVAGRGVAALQAAGIEVQLGLESQAAASLNAGFIKRMTLGRSYLHAKMAVSLDGKIALDNGKSQWITSQDSRKDLHYLRATHDAIMTSGQTIRSDDARLNVRLDSSVVFEPPVAVVLDSSLNLSPQASIFQVNETPPLVFFNPERASSLAQKSLSPFATLIEAPASVSASIGLDLSFVLQCLARDYRINRVLLESGSVLMSAAMEAGLIDELTLYMAPIFLGSQKSCCTLLRETLESCPRLTSFTTTVIGDDIKWHGYLSQKEALESEI